MKTLNLKPLVKLINRFKPVFTPCKHVFYHQYIDETKRTAAPFKPEIVTFGEGESVTVLRRHFTAQRTCKVCGHVETVSGYDQRDHEETETKTLT